MKQKIVALLLVAIMTLSACAAVGLTATPVAAQTATSVYISGPNKADVNEFFAMSVMLLDSNSHGIPNAQVTIYSKDNSGSWAYFGKVTTDSRGFAYFIDGVNTPLVVSYYAKFAGNSQYAPSKSNTVTVDVRYATRLSLYGPSSVKSNQWYDASGYLKDNMGQPLAAGTKLTVQHRLSGSSTWQNYGTVTTDSDGYYYFLGYSNAAWSYRVVYVGDTTHWGSTSPTLTVKPS